MSVKYLEDIYREPYKCQICGSLTGYFMVLCMGLGVDKLEAARNISNLRNYARCLIHQGCYDIIDDCYTDIGAEKNAGYARRGRKSRRGFGAGKPVIRY